MAKNSKRYTDADMAEVLDSPEWTAEDFRDARPFPDVFPELAEKLAGRRGKTSSPRKSVAVKVDSDIVEKFRATGPDWRQRINTVLRKAAGLK